jgi:hypothetical protein
MMNEIISNLKSAHIPDVQESLVGEVLFSMERQSDVQRS